MRLSVSERSASKDDSGALQYSSKHTKMPCYKVRRMVDSLRPNACMNAVVLSECAAAHSEYDAPEASQFLLQNIRPAIIFG